VFCQGSVSYWDISYPTEIGSLLVGASSSIFTDNAGLCVVAVMGYLSVALACFGGLL
jgi:hypothetical protein